MRLINARPSPYGRKVAVALLEKELTFEVQYDVPWGEATCVPDYNPLEQLPILILDDDSAIYDSTYILEWLERKHPQPNLLPKDIDELLKAKLIQVLGERLHEFARTVVFELQREKPAQAWVDRHVRKIRRGLSELERLVGDRRPTTSDPITLGDIAVATTLQVWPFMIANNLVPDLPVLNWRDAHPNLAGFVDALEDRPSFRNTRPEMMDVDLKAVTA